jgi:hypothetical protein
VGRIVEGNPLPDFALIREAVDDIVAALALQNSGQMQRAAGRLLALADQGMAQERTWEKIMQVGERIRALSKDQTQAEVMTGDLVARSELDCLVNVFQGLMWKFIPQDQMRAAFLRILRSQWVPEQKDVTPQLEAVDG